MRRADIIKFLAVLTILTAIIGVSRYELYSDQAAAPVKATQEASVDNERPVDSVTFVAEPGTSVLDQLIATARVETKASEYGTLVESINGVVNGTDGKYWLFYVNGKMADRGADAFVTEGGEAIEWKFEK